MMVRLVVESSWSCRKVRILSMDWRGIRTTKTYSFDLKINSCRYPQQLRRSWIGFGHLSRSAPESSGTSLAICPETLRNLIRNLPEFHQPSAPEPSGTLRNLVWNLVLQLHRVAPELFWAKDPIASFAVGEKQTKSNSFL